MPATFMSFGTGCATSAGVLGLSASDRPRIGRDVVLEAGPLPAGIVPVFVPLLLLGVDDTSWGGIPLPLDLTPAGMPGCSLLVSVDAILPMERTGTAARATLMVPLDRSLLGTEMFAQALVVVRENATSSAGRLVFGN